MTNDRHARGERQTRAEVGRVPATNLRLVYARLPDSCPEPFSQLLDRLKRQALQAKERAS